ncbi:MAG TPA: 2-oxo acid dehydrogenase subunit E2 [Amycolatopsis sp.]|nr:2-oxo acid dehydrogenase subunit E2 [Amycolatopsis sp.]
MTAGVTPWPSGETRDRLRPIQQVIAERLQRSWQTVVPATLMTEVDASGLLTRRKELADSGRRAGITAIVAGRLVRVLARHPAVNCRLDGEDVVSWSSVNLGVAISVGGRDLVVGVVPAADQCDEPELGERIGELQRRAESRRLRPQDTTGAAVTLSSVGMLIDDVAGTPIVPPGQTAVVLVSGVKEKPVVRDGAVVAAPVMPVSLTVDHRVVNGAAMAAFLKDLCGALESASEEGK